MSDAESLNGDRDRETLDDPKLWETSSASSEDWNEDAEWTVEIVGEEVRNKKIQHEVVWHGWQRPTDGTSNTWPLNPEEEGIDTNEWERLAAKRRKDLAKQSTKVYVWSDTSLVDTDTRLRSQAYEEKLDRSKERPSEPASRSRNNLQRHGRGRNPSAERSDGESSPPPRPVSHRRRPVAASRSSGSVSSSVSQSLPSSSIAASDKAVSSKRGRPSTASRNTAAALDRPTFSISQSRFSRQPVRSKSPPHSRQTQESDEEDYIHKSTVEGFHAPPHLPSKRKQQEDLSHETVPPKPTSKGKGKACPRPQPDRMRSVIEQTASHSARKVVNLPVRAQGTFRTSSAPLDSSQLPQTIHPVWVQPKTSATYTNRELQETQWLSFTPPPSIQPKSLVTHRRREALSAQWTQAAQSKGAASVTFVNEIDDEESPPLKGFCYLEKDYNYDNIEHPGRDEKDFFSYCDHRTCGTADECECPTQGNIGFAYDAYGRFVGNVDGDLSPFVVECNEYCACDRKKCHNRVAQLPRKVPVEIFKTRRCGWGARASVYVEKGTVLGLYTGKIIYRRDAELLKGEAKSFCFDMDGREDPEEELPEESYTVDAKTCGNWTRFLNHSCAPNVKVYSAVWTTIPESNLPCLVYYAAEDIPARKEFTVDYNPSQARLHAASKGKKKGKNRIPKGAIPCECGTKACRGWVTEACDY